MENFINNAPFALVLVCLVIGFVLLIKGADFFVEGSSSAAKRLHVPSIIIGLTIVAMEHHSGDRGQCISFTYRQQRACRQ